MHVVLGEDPRQAGEIMRLSWFRYLPIFPQKICRKWLERGRSREPLLGLLPPGQHVHWWLFKGDERMRLHFAAFHAFPHELHTVFYESFLHETVYPPAGSLVCVLVFDKVSS